MRLSIEWLPSWRCGHPSSDFTHHLLPIPIISDDDPDKGFALVQFGFCPVRTSVFTGSFEGKDGVYRVNIECAAARNSKIEHK
jgi:hypothetical protein